MNVLLSIEPKYAEAVFSGIKKYEFRRTIFKRKDIDRVYLYSNSTVKKIVGSFEVGIILDGTPQEIWKKCHKYGGISEEDFFKYFAGARKAFAIEIKNAQRFSEPIDPYSTFVKFTPPQSFYYLTYDIEGRMG